MKISYNWLKSYINPIPSPEECSSLLTATGLEIEGVEKINTIKGGLRGLVVAEVKTCEPHPNADKLKITQVDAGGEELLCVVCGAPNVAAGQKVIFATIGTELFSPDGESFKIKKSKIRGEVSEGMLCAQDEIGIGKSHDGIIVLPDTAQVGMPAAEYYQIKEDVVLEIGLTPNRTDAMSHMGVARDLRASLYKKENYSLLKPEVKQLNKGNNLQPMQVEVLNSSDVTRYSGVSLKNLKIGESPDWLKNALLAIGQKPVNNIVDVTNFVLHETGQPLHAFDREKINGGIIKVNSCTEGTSFITLDGIERKLKGTELMISNADSPMCLAGVFGGAYSGVSDSTTSIFLESACFNAVSVRKTARLHGLNTDSSFRFERGTNPEDTIFALERAVYLLMEVADAEIDGDVFDYYPNPVQWHVINLRWRILNRLVGEEIPKEIVKSILTLLGIKINAETDEGLELSIPPFKVDVKNEADITEEVLRIYGYNAISIPQQVRSTINIIEGPDAWKLKNKISDRLCSLGFYEALNNSLSAGSFNELLPESKDLAVHLLNPLSSELNVMRRSMLFGLCESLSRNANRQLSDVALFEWGKVYSLDVENKKYIEREKLAMLMHGDVFPANWHGETRKSGFFTLKGVIENSVRLLGIDEYLLSFNEVEHPAFINSFEILCREKSLGVIAELSSKSKKQFDLPSSVWYADLDWAVLLKAHSKSKFQYQEVSKFPSVKRDLALVIDESVSFKGIYQTAVETERKILKDVNLFDVYSGDKLAKGKKSYAVSFVLQDEAKTLNDKQVELVMEKLLNAFKSKLGAELRN